MLTKLLRCSLACCAMSFVVRAQDVTAPPVARAAPAKVATTATFAWTVPASVIVTESVTKKGRDAKLRYRLDIARREGGGLRISYHDFEFLMVAGRDATTPAMKKALASTAAMASAIPDLLVRADGSFEKAGDLQEVTNRVIAFMKESRGMTDDEADSMRKMMSNPRMAEVLQASIGRYWDCWVGSWREWDLAPGVLHEETQERPLMGETVPMKLTARHLGAAPKHKDCVKLELKIACDGPEAGTAMRGLMFQMLTAAGDDDPDFAEQFKASFAETLTVITDPSTLRPRVAISNRVIRLEHGESKDVQEHVERHQYEFDWQ